MTITKFVHSCLLVETSKQNILIDPGSFSWDSHLLNPNHLPPLSHIIITHEHTDHYHEPALRALSQRFPHAKIITNNDLVGTIKALKLPNPLSGSTEEGIMVFEAPHVALPMKLPSPLNIGVHIDEQLTHPGDAFNLSRSCGYLALPITAPFTSFKEALNAAVKLKPKAVIPVHDWEWHSAARQARYNFAKELLQPKKIEIIEMINGEPVEL